MMRTDPGLVAEANVHRAGAELQPHSNQEWMS